MGRGLDAMGLGGDVARRPAFWGAAAGVIAFTVYHLTTPYGTPFVHYVYLADAFLHGRLELINPPPTLEVAVFGGSPFVIPPPFPALLLLPSVAVAGLAASQSLISQVVGAVGAAATALLAARLVRRPADVFWLGLSGAFGTILWFMSAVGSTWFFAHVVAATALTLAVLETVGAARPLRIGAAVAAAYGARLPAMLTLPFFLVATSNRWAPGGLRAWRRVDLAFLIRLLGPIALALALNGLYNWLRFDRIGDVA
ncbi:MAG: hypothetical protein ACREN5_17415, partial [Gemmatimonadales bacterium]